MARHNLYCFSADYMMNTPKPGYEDQHKEASAEVELLKEWLKEFHSTCTDSTIEFIGIVGSIQYGKSYDGNPRVNHIEIDIDTGNGWYNGDRRILHVGEEAQKWFISGKYDMEKDRRQSRLMRFTVDRINCIRNIEWVFAEEIE